MEHRLDVLKKLLGGLLGVLLGDKLEHLRTVMNYLRENSWCKSPLSMSIIGKLNLIFTWL